jgi:membrane protease YdiL (CAAX protease family)
MSFFVAAMWSIAARLASDLMMTLLASARPTGRVDLVSNVLCEGVGFVGTLFFLSMVHDRETPLSEVLGLRRTSAVLCGIALVTGVLLQGPITLVLDAIYRRFPPSDAEVEMLRDLLSPKTLREKVALFAGVGVFGPVVEEAFFRGGILRNLRRRHASGLTVVGTSLLFAAAHLDPRNFLPDLLGGLAMGYVRILSGSLWPAIFLHAAFNSSSVLVALCLGPEADLFSRPESFAAIFATLGFVALYVRIALRSPVAAEAREKESP